MKVSKTEIPDVLLIEPQVFGDERGFFYESFNEKLFAQKTGISLTLFRIITLVLAKMCCEVYTIRFSNRKGN